MLGGQGLLVAEHSEKQTVILTAQAITGAQTREVDACMVFLYPPGPLMGRRLALEKELYAIGRSADTDVQIERDSVSRRHAQIIRVQRGWRIEDLGSTNGVYVNDQRLDERTGRAHTLRDGDIVKIGDAILKFLSGENVEAAYHEEIYRLTIVDGLTGLANKRHFLEFLDREVAAAARYGHPISLIMMDLDHFKRVNDSHGHLVGDLVLKELAGRIKSRVRREDLAARYGGEEFAIILTHTEEPGARAFAEAVRAIVAATPFVCDGVAIPCTISLGVASLASLEQPSSPTELRSVRITDLIKVADDRLYRAKEAGRDRVV